MATHTDLQSINRPGSPNTYLIAPDRYCRNATVDEPAPVFDAPREKLASIVRRTLEALPRCTIVSADESVGQFEAVAATKLLKFKDDITIDVLDAENQQGKSTLAIYSRSRVGYSDLGANRKRVHELVAMIQSELGKSP